MAVSSFVLELYLKIDRFVRKLHFSATSIFWIVTFKRFSVLLQFLKHYIQKNKGYNLILSSLLYLFLFE